MSESNSSLKLSAEYCARFPEIPESAWPLLERWAAGMREWNEKVNLVSRKDIDNLERKHLAHCLAITRKLKLMNGARVIDIGTGGGMPGVPMAICYPHARFTLIDSVGKKIKVVSDLVEQLELKNVEVIHGRVETVKREFDFAMGRAVTQLPAFISWARKLIRPGKKHSLDNGILYWKGGAWEPELEGSRLQPWRVFSIGELVGDTTDDAYLEKYILQFRQQDVKFFKRPQLTPKDAE